MKTVVKICGLRRVEDAELAIELGAAFVGCVLAADSPRRASHEEARRIVDCAKSAGARAVLVFRDPRLDEVDAAVQATGAERVQIHGGDSSSLGLALQRRGLRVLPVVSLAPASSSSSATSVPRLPARSSDAPCVLDQGRGGSGRNFDWARLGGRAPNDCLIAGGIRPENVTELLTHAPWGIDVSSGLETSPGVKDAGRMRELFARIHARAGSPTA